MVSKGLELHELFRALSIGRKSFLEVECDDSASQESLVTDLDLMALPMGPTQRPSVP